MDAGMQDWIERQFLHSPLGDVRRGRRLAKVAGRFAEGGADVSGTITSVMGCPAESDAAYRLFDCEEVTHANVIAEHCRQVREVVSRPGTYLLIEDSTALAFPGLREALGLGPIGEDYTRGLWLHTTLAVCPGEVPQVLGLLDQQWWARPPKKPARRKSTGRGKESNHARQKREDRESKRWAKSLIEVAAGRAVGCRWIYVADRESDIYEVFLACQGSGISRVIRAAYSRALAQEEYGYLKEAVSGAAVLGYATIELPREDRRARLEVRGMRVELRGPSRPGGRLPNHVVNVVQVKEVDVPPGCQAVEWTLLTDLPVETLEQCLEVVEVYRHRWLIEEFHKALKTGLKVEKSQLSDGRRLSALGGMLSVIATRLLGMKLLARHDPQGRPKAEQVGTGKLEVLRQLYPPKGPMTWRWVWRSIAMLGGFMGRKGDGNPGWLTIWRGWQRLESLAQGYTLATRQKCGER